MSSIITCLTVLCICQVNLAFCQVEKQYANPIIFADYSDPDVVCVGKDCYMTASSFNCVPGLPILHSTDLINWRLVNYALPKLSPEDNFNSPQHGNGIWAPCIKYHDGWYYIFYGDPDFGIYMTKTQNPKSDWTEPHLVHAAKGWIDPSPFWDEDGKAYLVHAFAGSRASIKSILVMHEMKPDGTGLLNSGVLIHDGHKDNPTIEGPKLYKKNGYYYIFAPGGGVTYGWQTVLRAKNIYGPYMAQKVLHTGTTDINGPHQGAWVKADNGDDWFIHFQDKGPWGRVVHMQPVTWENDWPKMGFDLDGDGIGEPVTTYGSTQDKLLPKQFSIMDAFDGISLNKHWQWHANPKTEWAFLQGDVGKLRLYAIERSLDEVNLYHAGNLLLQKFVGPAFEAETKIDFKPTNKGPEEKIGLLIMGLDYSYIALSHAQGKLKVEHVVCYNADNETKEEVIDSREVNASTIYFKVCVDHDAQCQFSYSFDGKDFIQFGDQFKARQGKWIGAKVGLFAQRSGKTNDSGYADIDYFNLKTTH